MPRTIELEFWKGSDKLWNLSVDGIVHAQSHFEIQVRKLADSVKTYNPGINFVEVEVEQDDRDNPKTLHLV